MSNMKKCKIEKCDRSYYAKEFCNYHYQKWRKYNNPLGRTIYPEICTVVNCQRLFYGRGYCFSHYRKWRRWGDPTYKFTWSLERRLEQGRQRAKENNPSWRGGKTTQNKLDRVKFQQNLQPLIFQRDNYTCQICNEYSGYLQVDHIKSWKDYPELRFNTDNCRTLCMACHYYVTFKRKMPKGMSWGHNLSKRTTS